MELLLSVKSAVSSYDAFHLTVSLDSKRPPDTFSSDYSYRFTDEGIINKTKTADLHDAEIFIASFLGMKGTKAIALQGHSSMGFSMRI